MSDPRERVREFLDAFEDEDYSRDLIAWVPHAPGVPSTDLTINDLRDVLNELDAADRILDHQHHCRNGVCT